MAERKKDGWDKFQIVSALIQPIVLSVFGSYFAWEIHKEDVRDRRAQTQREQLALVEQQREHSLSSITALLPLLDNPKQRRGALIALDGLGNPEVAARLGQAYGDGPSIDALKEIATSKGGGGNSLAMDALNRIASRGQDESSKKAIEALAELKPNLMFIASPNKVAAGQSIKLQWRAEKLSKCEASGNWTGSKATSGEETIGPIVEDQSFNLNCVSSHTRIIHTLTIAVAPHSETAVPSASNPPAPPTVTLSADPTNLGTGQAAVLSWSSTSAEKCEADGGWSGIKPPAGSEIVGPLTSTTTFSLTCSGPSGIYANNVDVEPAPTRFIGTVPPSASNSSGGGSMELSWILFFAALVILKEGRNGDILN